MAHATRAHHGRRRLQLLGVGLILLGSGIGAHGLTRGQEHPGRQLAHIEHHAAAPSAHQSGVAGARDTTAAHTAVANEAG